MGFEKILKMTRISESLENSNAEFEKDLSQSQKEIETEKD